MEHSFSLRTAIDFASAVLRQHTARKENTLCLIVNPWLPCRFVGDDKTEAAFRYILIGLALLALGGMNKRACTLSVDAEQFRKGTKAKIRLCIKVNGEALASPDKEIVDQLQAIAKSIGGEIAVQENEGADIPCFVCELPLKVEDWTAVAEVSDPTTKTILLYDNDKARGESLREAFASLGLRYEHAESQEGLLDAVCGRVFTHVLAPEYLIQELMMFVDNMEEKPGVILIADKPGKPIFDDARQIVAPLYSANLAEIFNETA